jgi:hypothetical protein
MVVPEGPLAMGSFQLGGPIQSLVPAAGLALLIDDGEDRMV